MLQTLHELLVPEIFDSLYVYVYIQGLSKINSIHFTNEGERRAETANKIVEHKVDHNFRRSYLVPTHLVQTPLV